MYTGIDLQAIVERKYAEKRLRGVWMTTLAQYLLQVAGGRFDVNGSDRTLEANLFDEGYLRMIPAERRTFVRDVAERVEELPALRQYSSEILRLNESHHPLLYITSRSPTELPGVHQLTARLATRQAIRSGSRKEMGKQIILIVPETSEYGVDTQLLCLEDDMRPRALYEQRLQRGTIVYDREELD